MSLFSSTQVAWLRPDSLSILSVGRFTYTGDTRFLSSFKHHRLEEEEEEDDDDDDGDEDGGGGDVGTWTLQIREVLKQDEGRYECQISTQPVKSFFVNLRVVGECASVLSWQDQWQKKSQDVEQITRKASLNLPDHENSL